MRTISTKSQWSAGAILSAKELCSNSLVFSPFPLYHHTKPSGIERAAEPDPDNRASTESSF